jgi:hypothetical protein
MQYKPSTQSETYLPLIGRSIRLYFAAFSKIYLIALAMALITFVPRLFTLLIGQDVLSNLSAFSIGKFIFLAIDFINLFFLAAILWHLQCVSHHDTDTFKSDMEIAAKKLPAVIAAVIVQGLFFMLVILATYTFNNYLLKDAFQFKANLGWQLFITIPFLIQLGLSVFIPILFYFYVPLILTENKGFISALFRSARLVWGNWWRTFWVQLTPWILYLIILLTVKYWGHFEIHLYFVPLKNLSFVATLLHIFIFSLILPFFATTLFVQLRDLELRKNLTAP